MYKSTSVITALAIDAIKKLGILRGKKLRAKGSSYGFTTWICITYQCPR